MVYLLYHHCLSSYLAYESMVDLKIRNKIIVSNMLTMADISLSEENEAGEGGGAATAFLLSSEGLIVNSLEAGFSDRVSKRKKISVLKNVINFCEISYSKLLLLLLLLLMVLALDCQIF